MARDNRHGQVRSKKRIKSEKKFPQIYLDSESDFASIKIAPGVEARSFMKDGFVFCENEDGEIIEIQVMNLSGLKKGRSTRSA